ncbi:MAG: DUF6348 family protein [Thermodesulfobacteriota bacterium]
MEDISRWANLILDFAKTPQGEVYLAALALLILLCLARILYGAAKRGGVHAQRFLLSAFSIHGVHCVQNGDLIAFPELPYTLSPHVQELKKAGKQHVVQLDIVLEGLPGGRSLVESFAGWGGSGKEALVHALNNFVMASLHVFLAAFFNADDHQVMPEQWTIGGRKKTAFSGDLIIMGAYPDGQMQPEDFFRAFEEKIRKRPMEPGVHWVRFFFGRMKESQGNCEVLLDNEPWTELQEEMAGLAWPVSDSYYSIRQFTVFTDAEKTPPEAA